MIRIAIVDDHATVRLGLRTFLAHVADITVVAEAAGGREAEALVRAGGIDVMLLDISMPDRNGIDVLRYAALHPSKLKVLMLSSFPEDIYGAVVMRFGAKGYLTKGCSAEDIIAAIRTAHSGGRYITPELAQALADFHFQPEQPLHEHLSQRELQVFVRLARGEKATRIGNALSLSPSTVSMLAHQVKSKMGMPTSSELTHYAVKHGMIQ